MLDIKVVNVEAKSYICRKATRMYTTEEILMELRRFKAEEALRYGIEGLALVGSAARGEQTEQSDIDICVKLKKTTFRIYMAVKEELEKRFSVKVDLITIHTGMRQFFRQNLEKDAIFV